MNNDVTDRSRISNREWIGVDLDGTAAEWHGWQPEIGKPIPKMIAKIQAALESGMIVKIMTARVWGGNQTHDQVEQQRKLIQDWCLKHIGVVLEVTNQKDWYMVELWDDRARQVVENTGMFLEEFLTEAA